MGGGSCASYQCQYLLIIDKVPGIVIELLCEIHNSVQITHKSPALLTALEKDDSLLRVQSRAWKIGVVSHTCGLGFW